MFSAIDYENNASAIDDAARAGVKIVAIDSSVASEMVSTYIGTDNYAGGPHGRAGRARARGGRAHRGIVNYDISSANGQEREHGAVDLLQESGRAEVAAVINTLAEAGQAKEDTEAMLAEHPEINVLLAFNEPTSVGARRGRERARPLRERVPRRLRLQRRHRGRAAGGQRGRARRAEPLRHGLPRRGGAPISPRRPGRLPRKDRGHFYTGGGRENIFTMDSQKALFAFRAVKNSTC